MIYIASLFSHYDVSFFESPAVSIRWCSVSKPHMIIILIIIIIIKANHKANDKHYVIRSSCSRVKNAETCPGEFGVALLNVARLLRLLLSTPNTAGYFNPIFKGSTVVEQHSLNTVSITELSCST